MAHTLFVVFVLCAFVADDVVGQDSRVKYANDEQKLRTGLFKNYDVDLVPTKTSGHTATVKFGLTITAIDMDEYAGTISLNTWVTMDEYAGTISLNTWVTMKWSDFRLTWKPDMHGNVTKLRVRATNLWTPDITLYNSDEITTAYDQNVKVIVDYDGNITWVPPEKLTVKCDLNIQHFPYDTHECQLMFGSWTHDGFVVDIQLDSEYNLSEHKDVVFRHLQVGHFQGDDATVKRYAHKYPCCEEPYPLIIFTLKFSRRAGIYHRIFVTPCVLLGLLSSMIFLLPHTTGERTCLGIGVFFCLTLMCLWVGEIFPGSLLQAPNILLYYTSVMIMTMISLCLAGLTSSMRYNKQPPGAFIRRMIDKLRCLTCVSSANYQYMPEDPVQDNNGTPATEPSLQLDDESYTVSRPERPTYRVDQWQMIGTIVDRMLFVVHFAITAIVTLSLMRF